MILQSISQNDSQVSSALQDSIIRGGNRIFCENGFDWQADEMWKLGTLIGIFGRGNDKEIIQKLAAMEARDRTKRVEKQMKSTNVGDENVPR